MSSMKYVYSRAGYLAAEKYVRQTMKGIVTRSGLVKFIMESGKTVAAASATAAVFLSPRLVTTRKGCDCRGNFSAQGHKYYMQPLKRVEGQERKFKFCIRAKELERHVRPAAVKSVKAVTKKTAKKVAPAVVAPAVETPVTA